MNTPATIRVKATDEASQGQFVVINAADFNPDMHTLLDEQDGATDEAGSVDPTRRRGRPRKQPQTES